MASETVSATQNNCFNTTVMLRLVFFLLALAIGLAIGDPIPQQRKFITTADRITAYNYPVEQHTVQTSDAYILKMFRIPYSPRLKNQHVQHKPVMFLMHGLLSSSDCWILNGPENALAYLLADAGYDVWLGNARGNTYSKRNAKISPLLPAFWNFSWNEIGIYDLPAMIDYILQYTTENTLHFVGHSQGNTAFLVLLSSIPEYNKKIRTSHILAPVGYMKHMQSPLVKLAGPVLGEPSLLSDLIGSNEFMPSNELLSVLGSEACANKSPVQPICGDVLFLMVGWDSQHLNYTLLPEVAETHPAGASSSQVIHYLQEYESGYFRKYDHGVTQNKKDYHQKTPPNYLLRNIRPEVPLEFYYGENDYFAAVVDVMHLAKRLGRNANLYRVKYKDWNHLDFLWALEVKAVINDRIIELANKYEASHANRNTAFFM